MRGIRPPAVAGSFYPADADALRSRVRHDLQAASEAASGDVRVPVALIVPHAGLVYSGPVAASAYARLAPVAEDIKRVVLIGPAHWVPLRGVALSTADAFATPLGDVPVDQQAVAALGALPQVYVVDEAHVREHSLEVQLPFLQSVLDTFQIVPLVVGQARAEAVGEVLELLWNGPQTLVVVSSDLSHYHDYDTARRLDADTSRAIEALRVEAIRPDLACGAHAIQGLLVVARHRGWRVETIDLRNSGDTAGPRDRVVGYGAYVVTKPAEGQASRRDPAA